MVATRIDLPAPVIDIVHPGFSDHRLLEWTSDLDRPAPVYRQMTCRPWRSVPTAELVDSLRQSAIIAPQRLVTIRPRRSDPWFDPECRAAKRQCRQLERRARRSAADSDTVAAWHNQLRDYRALLDRKRTVFWTNTIEALQ